MSEHDQDAMDAAFREWRDKEEKKLPLKTAKDKEIDAQIAELFGDDPPKDENEGEFNSFLKGEDRRAQARSALLLRNYLVKEWFAMFSASQWVKEMHFGAIICILKDEAEDAKVREVAQTYWQYMENAKNMLKRPDSNDDFWRLLRKIRNRWEQEVKIDWTQVITREIPKMEHPHNV